LSYSPGELPAPHNVPLGLNLALSIRPPRR